MSWSRLRTIGLLTGPLTAAVAYALLPETYRNAAGAEVAFTPAGRATFAAMIWMAVWWLTEAVDIEVTALLPLALFPLAGVRTIAQAAAPYASDLIFLFMGGFVLALAMQRWGLDRRIALRTLRVVGARPRNVVGGMMLVTAALSMWVSNTATAAVMLPIALSVIRLAEAGRAEAGATPDRPFALSLLLGIAYGASIGGMVTLIGSPPNGILAQFMRTELGRDIGFARWLAIGGPVGLVLLPVAWWLLVVVLYPPRDVAIAGGPAWFDAELRGLGAMSRGERIVLLVFALTALAWLARPWLVLWSPGGDWRPLAGLSDAGVAILAALALFVLPAGGHPPGAPPDVDPRGVRLIDWATAERLPWGVLVLFGGGLSLAAAVQANGVAEFIGAQAGWLRDLPPLVLVLAVTVAVIFLTELTSNTATTATLVPVLAALAVGMGIAPELLIVPATLAASCAFMLPVATPPNAIVFGSGAITLPEMARAGLWLNLVGIGLITGLLYSVILPLLGIAP